MATITQNQDGSFTVVLTNREQAALQRSATEKGETLAAFVSRRINSLINEFQQKWRQRDADARQEAYDAATNNVKSQIDTLLGLD